MPTNISDPLENFMRDLNPKDRPDMPELVFGRRYRCWKDGELIGIFTWTEDKHIGGSFLRPVKGLNAMEVGVPDRWEEIK